MINLSMTHLQPQPTGTGPQSGTGTGYGWGSGNTNGWGATGTGALTTGTFGVGGNRAMIMFGMVTDGAGGTGTRIGTGCGTGAKEMGGETGAGIGHPQP